MVRPRAALAGVLLSFALAHASAASARTIPLRIDLRRPPELALPGVRSLAVGPIEGDLADVARDRLGARISEGASLRLVARAEADAVVGIRVEQAAARDEDETTPLYKNSAEPGGDPVVIQAPTRVRSGRAVISFTVRSAADGRALAARTATGRWSARSIEDPRPDATCLACYLFRDNPLDESGDLPGVEETRRRAVEAAVEEFVGALTPRDLTLDLIWDEGHRGIPGGAEIPDLLRSGQVEEARSRIEQVRIRAEQDPATREDRALRATIAYDCGVVAEAAGDLTGARAWYARALDEAPGKPDRVWIEASRRVRQHREPAPHGTQNPREP